MKTVREFLRWQLQGSWVFEDRKLKHLPVKTYYLMLAFDDWNSRGLVDRKVNVKGLTAVLTKMAKEGEVCKAQPMNRQMENSWVWAKGWSA